MPEPARTTRRFAACPRGRRGWRFQRNDDRREPGPACRRSARDHDRQSNARRPAAVSPTGVGARSTCSMWRHATCPHFPTMPDHFLRWVSTRPEFEAVPEIDLRERFIPRQTYGDYVSFVAQKYLAASGNGTPVSSRFVIGEAVDIEPQEFGCLVRLADGSTLEADRVVLATGNETPASLPGAEGLAEHPAWIGRSVAGLGRTVAAEGLNRRRSRYRPDGGRRDHHPAHHRVAGHHPRGVAARMVPACTLQRNRVPRIPAPGSRSHVAWVSTSWLRS